MARARPIITACVLTMVVVTAAVSCSSDDGDDGDGAGADEEETTTTSNPAGEPVLAARNEPLPVVTPTPHDIRWLGPDVPVPSTVNVIAADGVGESTTAAVRDALEAAGARDVKVTAAAVSGAAPGAPAALTVRIATVDDDTAASQLAAVGIDVPGDLPAEGYALAAYSRDDGSADVVLAGADDAGAFYAAQTLRQLMGDGTIAAVGVVDRPAMRHRGAIEGFYGSPWTHAERLDQMAFYGRFKLNTYVYAPKDDPYHRDRWRDPYPDDLLDGLRSLVEAAAAHHVRFTFAVSPGVSICYSEPADIEVLTTKLDAVYDLGVRAFSIALDDIDHTRWNCDADGERYGAPSTEAAARAQVDLLNGLQRGFVAGHEGAQPLQMVPTEYRNTDDSPYRRVIREQLDGAVEVMWTGPFVVPAEITVAQAAEAATVFGRPTLVWDNTPVNDFPPTEGRLILAPYARREPGLSEQVTGIVLNPMNQAAASKVQLVGGADFTWNDADYDADRAHRAAANYLAGGAGGGAAAGPVDAATVDALLAFFDVENLAPTSASSGIVSQPQAPALAAELETFRASWDGGDPAAAVAGLRPYSELLAAAPERIRAGVVDDGFLADCAPWLDATALWGQALAASLDALDARIAGDAAATQSHFEAAEMLAGQAGAIRTIPGETRPEGPVRVADGVLDTFVAEARGLVVSAG
ncbi:MAG TPA: beta-N-acetylglucosaminidase domain-containing protein [Acidimicrobiales bacterium]|nr:beta-N-acetylglucosaminidase domain-containing protein [Acidimicrobiales bacterium]